MTAADPPRKLAAIVSIDIAGYSSLTEQDPARAAQAVALLRERASALSGARAGRIFNTAGDGVMLEFGSASDALTVALSLCASDLDPPIRAGIHLGEVRIAEGGDLLGHGVNVAARLQAEAAPRGVLVSQIARDVMTPDLLDRLTPRGKIKLAKMRETISVFAAGPTQSDARTSEPILAVLPFDSLARDRGTQSLSDGMTEEVLHLVSRIPGLKVIGSTSSFAFRGRRKSKAAAALAATHVLDGSVQRAGEKVRVTAKLTDAESAFILWSERYDGDIRDAFALQEAIAQKTAGSLALAFSEIRRARAVKIDAALFDLYVKGRRHLRLGAAKDFADAADIFERVVRAAPEFVRAWAGLATARLEVMRLARHDRVRLADEARDAAERTIGLDPDIAEPYAVLAALESEFGRWSEREALLKRALAAEPNNPLLLFRYGQFLVSTGQMNVGHTYQARAFELDPLDPMFAAFYGYNVWTRVSKTQGRRVLDDAAERYPDNVFVWYMRLTTSMLDGDMATTNRLREEGKHIAPEIVESANYKSSLMVQEVMSNPTPEAFAALPGRVSALAEAEPSAALDLGVTLSVLGQSLPALDMFERALGDVDLWRQAAPESARPHIGYETALLFIDATALLRINPAFVHLCERLGLIRYWRDAGVWPDCAADVAAIYDFKAECVRVSLN